MEEIAVFGGGCFWCLEAVFKMIRGVKRVIPGYTGGITEDPDYNSVCLGSTGHAEVVKIEYDPDKVSYKLLLEVFFSSHDPTTLNRQGNDTGTQYRSIILYTTQEQKKLASDYINDLIEQKAYTHMIVTEIKPLEKFYEAEEYHKDYFSSHKRAPYCQAVINPKVEKIKDKFSRILE